MPHKSRGIRGQYDQAKLQLAVYAVKTNRKSVRQASKDYGIPKSTISCRLTGRVQHGEKPGVKSVFSLEV